MKKILIIGFLLAVLFLSGCSKDPSNGDDSINGEAVPDESYKINTLGWEDSPYVTPDDKEFYFMYNPWNFFPIFSGGLPSRSGPDRLGHQTESVNPFAMSEIYVSTKTPTGWSTPVNLGIGEGCCAMVSADKQTIYYAKLIKGQQTDIYLARKQSDGSWGEPISIGSSINSSSKEINPHISFDEKTIYFASDRNGKMDLYYSKLNPDGSWGEPVTMGSTINTVAVNEDQIWVNAAENVVYFNRGGVSTILKSELVNGQWTAPVEITFNTSSDIAEISFSNNLAKAYFALVDHEKKDIIFVSSNLLENGTWSKPQPLD
ncbi:PD40 domain-containing protein [archaeon]|nr:PD40 domain-containing protein [archaeon]